MSTPGTVWWLTGLAGAGKSTLARELHERLRQQGRSVVLLDGDVLRSTLFPAAGYTAHDRQRLAMSYARLCGLLASQGHDVVCATVSLYPEVWAHNRRALSHYREIFVHAPPEVLAQRRPQLYGGELGPVVGVHLAAPEPPTPHLRLLNDGGCTPEQQVSQVLAALGDRS